MSEEIKNENQSVELKLDDLNQVSGGTGESEQSPGACPKCGKHTLAVDEAKKAVVCTSCGYASSRLCWHCGADGKVYYEQSASFSHCHVCGWCPPYTC